MDTPIFDFLKGYQREGMSRLHMPGHKGIGPLGCEALDLTEIKGADSLYEADGIIAQSEENATRLFGTRRTFYSAGGSTQCVKAMLHLALTSRGENNAPVVLAARNVHKSFVFAVGLLGLGVEWLWPEEEGSLCACPVTPEGLEVALSAMEKPPCAVYITSPDYLGNMADVAALAAVAHRHGSLLLVDNAHGAYLHFLDKPCHPMDLGADLCCDSAHKTLPVLTGGAYLHISKTAPYSMEENARTALSLFGSTSPSYLIMASLDLCNGYLAGEGREDIQAAAKALSGLKAALTQEGWVLAGEEPLKLTLNANQRGWDGRELADLLRVGGVECEYADSDYVVLMVSGNTKAEDLRKVADTLSAAKPKPPLSRPTLPQARGEQALSIRQALLAPHETVPVDQALGRICAAPTVSCPPAIPIAVTGEVIGPEALALFRHYGVEKCEVVKE
ncbi:MAG: amino acid decarboxylase [Oscillospiraceae bacterium]|nr:amino acid decarboxylase [Oscillospiraceae bacterium]